MPFYTTNLQLQSQQSVNFFTSKFFFDGVFRRHKENIKWISLDPIPSFRFVHQRPKQFELCVNGIWAKALSRISFVAPFTEIGFVMF